MRGKYKFKQMVVRMRWIDYARIKHTFPPFKNESAADYFRRLALWINAHQCPPYPKGEGIAGSEEKRRSGCGCGKFLKNSEQYCGERMKVTEAGITHVELVLCPLCLEKLK